MITRLEDIVKELQEIDADISELERLKNRIPGNRPYTRKLETTFERQINELLNRKTALHDLEMEEPPPELMKEIFSFDLATASTIHGRARVFEPTRKEEAVVSFLKAIPKTEIHLHIEACISAATLARLLEKNKVTYTEEKLNKLYQFTDLGGFIELFFFILDAIKQPDDFQVIFQNLREYLQENNIRYAEVFLAPSKMIQNGLDFNEIMQVLDREARDCRLSGGPEVSYLIDVSRTFGPDNASKNLQRVMGAKVSSIIGIGLGGNELKGPARDFASVFAQARAAGLRTVAHAGEDDGPWSVRDTVEILKAERIGHGISMVQDPDLMEKVKRMEIPVEICLTSNIFTGKYVKREEDHPVRRYYDEGIICTINTDDPEIFNVTLTQEYFKFYKYLNFTITELIDLVRQGVYGSFHPQPAKLWSGFEGEIQRLRETTGL